MRRSGPGLIGRTAKTVARTAVIAGTATAVSGKVAGRQAAAAPDTPPVAAPSGLSATDLEQLKTLAELHASGVLTDEEFATQKARILH
nr:SHOCT domain-containing protein [Brevundimonas lenta]